jgi:hypothetical protein
MNKKYNKERHWLINFIWIVHIVQPNGRKFYKLGVEQKKVFKYKYNGIFLETFKHTRTFSFLFLVHYNATIS